MEFSSPLAALRPQPYPTWGSSIDVPESQAMYNQYRTFGSARFDFTSMSMHQQQSQPRRKMDYFSVCPTRGSSPTACLTADLDANFHIDKSPQAPTPRRSLFTADQFKPRKLASRTATPPTEIELATTPPTALSSPPFVDTMDISPLPHKLPRFVAQVTFPSPSPCEPPSKAKGIAPDLLCADERPPPFLRPVQAPICPPLSERRRPLTRPSLSRTKGLSNIPPGPISNPEPSSFAPFRFGNVASSDIACSSTSSLLDTFTDSDDPRESGPGSMPLPPRRPSFGSTNRAHGSPSANHVRKYCSGRSAFVRPQRKLIRRSLSMFQHPDDIMNEEQNAFEAQPSLLSSAMDDMEQEYTHKLPFFVPDHEPDSLPRITPETMLDVLDSKYAQQYDRVLVIDCRFEYEYDGGHIESAVNFNDKQQLANQLFGDVTPSRTLLVFHCEYSVHRAPLTAKFIRSHDRAVNAANYPDLTYPEMYILDGGYSQFFSQHPAKCFPQNYVEMNDQRHELACERGMARVKQQRQKLFRNQTFAFGQNDEMEDSPTACARGVGPRTQDTFTVGTDIAEGIGMSYQRRMASY